MLFINYCILIYNICFFCQKLFVNFEFVNIVCYLLFDVFGIVIVLVSCLFFNVNFLIGDDVESNEICYW